jgi:biopolymer transport protein ExbD
LINITTARRGNRNAVELNIAPLIDMVFILLIFFLVTTSFVKETGIDVNRPTASTAQLQNKGNILVGVSEAGRIFFEKRPIDLRSVRAHISRSLSENPEGAVVIVADRKSDTGVIVQIIDQCRLAGAKRVSIAATKPTPTE